MTDYIGIHKEWKIGTANDFSKCFKDVLFKNDSFDLKLIVGPGNTELKCHKLFMSQFSEPFHKMISSQTFCEGQTGVIRLPEEDPKVLEKIIDLTYLGFIIIKEDTIAENLRIFIGIVNFFCKYAGYDFLEEDGTQSERPEGTYLCYKLGTTILNNLQKIETLVESSPDFAHSILPFVAEKCISPHISRITTKCFLMIEDTQFSSKQGLYFREYDKSMIIFIIENYHVIFRNNPDPNILIYQVLLWLSEMILCKINEEIELVIDLFRKKFVPAEQYITPYNADFRKMLKGIFTNSEIIKNTTKKIDIALFMLVEVIVPNNIFDDLTKDAGKVLKFLCLALPSLAEKIPLNQNLYLSDAIFSPFLEKSQYVIISEKGGCNFEGNCSTFDCLTVLFHRDYHIMCQSLFHVHRNCENLRERNIHFSCNSTYGAWSFWRDINRRFDIKEIDINRQYDSHKKGKIMCSFDVIRNINNNHGLSIIPKRLGVSFEYIHDDAFCFTDLIQSDIEGIFLFKPLFVKEYDVHAGSYAKRHKKICVRLQDYSPYAQRRQEYEESIPYICGDEHHLNFSKGTKITYSSRIRDVSNDSLLIPHKKAPISQVAYFVVYTKYFEGKGLGVKHMYQPSGGGIRGQRLRYCDIMNNISQLKLQEEDFTFINYNSNRYRLFFQCRNVLPVMIACVTSPYHKSRNVQTKELLPGFNMDF